MRFQLALTEKGFWSHSGQQNKNVDVICDYCITKTTHFILGITVLEGEFKIKESA